MAFYLSYMADAAYSVGTLKARGPFDDRRPTSPPLFVGAAGLVFVSGLSVRPSSSRCADLWPESAAALGELHSPRAIAWAGQAAKNVCIIWALCIVAVTEGIPPTAHPAGYPAGKLAASPNGANTDLFQPQPALGAEFRAEHGLPAEAFVAIYAGIHGIAQGLETVLHAADWLRNDRAVRFVLVGEGPVKAELCAWLCALHLDNALLLPEQPWAAMPAILSAADAAVPLRKLELFQGASPSKMFDAGPAAGRCS